MKHILCFVFVLNISTIKTKNATFITKHCSNECLSTDIFLKDNMQCVSEETELEKRLRYLEVVKESGFETLELRQIIDKATFEKYYRHIFSVDNYSEQRERLQFDLWFFYIIFTLTCILYVRKLKLEIRRVNQENERLRNVMFRILQFNRVNLERRFVGI